MSGKLDLQLVFSDPTGVLESGQPGRRISRNGDNRSSSRSRMKVNDQITVYEVEAMFHISIASTEQNLFDPFTASGVFRYSQISSGLFHTSLTLQINTS
jgi:hypothetical protein